MLFGSSKIQEIKKKKRKIEENKILLDGDRCTRCFSINTKLFFGAQPKSDEYELASHIYKMYMYDSKEDFTMLLYYMVYFSDGVNALRTVGDFFCIIISKLE